MRGSQTLFLTLILGAVGQAVARAQAPQGLTLPEAGRHQEPVGGRCTRVPPALSHPGACPVELTGHGSHDTFGLPSFAGSPTSGRRSFRPV